MLLRKVASKLMFTNVIVPLDGTHEAAAAIPVARTLVALGGGRLSLLRVVHRPAGLFASHGNQVREASAYLDVVVRDKLAGVDLPIATHVRSGDDVVEAILDEVNGNASSVIVMTTRGHAGIVRAVLGSVASELLGKSPVPVVVVRAGVRPIEQVRQILVPIDLAPESEQALATAAGLASATGAGVTLLQVLTPTPVPTWASQAALPLEFGEYGDPGRLDRAALFEARRYVNALADRLETEGVAVERLATFGDVPSTITETADVLGTDLIVMRTRGHTGTARAVLGSVADAVVRSAAVPVMLLRGDEVYERLAAARQERSFIGEPVW
jgi:nucleotide-binding universal stress UspA family protein